MDQTNKRRWRWVEMVALIAGMAVMVGLSAWLVSRLMVLS